MNDRLTAYRIFTRIARLGSFSAAGRELNMPQPTVSRIVKALESELGVALLLRTTRAVTLTDAGRDFLLRIEAILDSLDDAEHAVRGTGELRGVLRVGLSSTIAVREIVPILPGFMAEHAKLKVELITDDQRQALVIEGIDVAIRFGKLDDLTAVAKHLADLPRGIVASPEYLAQYGVPESPSDIANHRIIAMQSSSPTVWNFNKNGTTTGLRLERHLLVTTNEVALASACCGLGIACMTLAAARREISAGKLVVVLPGWTMGHVPLHAVFPAGRAAKPAARVFVNYLADEILADITRE